MKIACLTFTDSGEKIGKQIEKGLDHEVFLINRSEVKGSLRDSFGEIFNSYDGIIFISSTGIAVRFIAPYVKDKTKDPAVVVVDDLGRHAISLLSGHIGGANELALKIAKIIDANPVITTASDGRGIEAVDVFAMKHALEIENMDNARILTAMMVSGDKVGLISELDLSLNYNNIDNENPKGYIIVTSRENIECDKPSCILRPKNLYIGIGCRRGKTEEEILNAMDLVFKENNLTFKSIKEIGTIEAKKDEKGIIDFCNRFGFKMNIFSNKEVEKVQHLFNSSNFVKETIGVTSVAEPCAYLLSNDVIIKRRAVDGVTIAVSRGR